MSKSPIEQRDRELLSTHEHARTPTHKHTHTHTRSVSLTITRQTKDDQGLGPKYTHTHIVSLSLLLSHSFSLDHDLNHGDQWLQPKYTHTHVLSLSLCLSRFEPRMIKGFGRRDSIVGVEVEKPIQQVPHWIRFLCRLPPLFNVFV